MPFLQLSCKSAITGIEKIVGQGADVMHAASTLVGMAHFSSSVCRAPLICWALQTELEQGCP